jgi:hypothetical protein
MATAPIEYGVALFYGLYETGGGPSTTYMVVQSDSFSESLALDVEVAGEVGTVITNHLDDRRIECTLDGVLKQGETTPNIGETFSYGGFTFILKSIEDKGTNKDYRKVTVKGIKYQEIVAA